MNVLYAFLFTCGFFAMGQTVVHAQSEKLRFEHLGVEQGLANNSAISILKDKRGYLWFATWNGLNKFDGYNFTTYQFDPADSNSIGGNAIRKVWEDKDGVIWVAALGTGVFTFDRYTENFVPFLPSAFSFRWVVAFNEDTDGMIWFVTIAGELGRYDKKTNQFYSDGFSKVMSASQDADFNSQLSGWDIYKDRSGSLWVMSNNGLHKINLLQGSKDSLSRVNFTHYQHNAKNLNSISSNTTRCVYEDRSGVFWIGTLNGVNRLNPKTGQFVTYQNDPKDSSSLSYNDVREIVEDKQGVIWIGTQIGLNKLNKDQKSFTRFFHDENDPSSLSSDFIYSMKIDSADIIWLATIGGGINKLDLNQGPVSLYQHNTREINSLSNNKVSAICEVQNGDVWIGTIGGGISVWNKKTNHFFHYRNNPLDSNTLATDTISAIIEDVNGNIWTGGGKSRVGIISKFNPLNSKFTHYSFSYGFSNVNKNPVLTFYFDHSGILWVGTTNGFLRFNTQTGTWIHYPHDPKQPEKLSDFWVNAICEDNKGYIWLGVNGNALDRFNPVTNDFTHYKHDPHDTNSISSTIVRGILKDANGTLWFATRHGGLCRLNSETGTFTTFSKRDGLPSNTVYSLIEDDDKKLWVTTNNGLSRFSIKDRKFTNFDVNDGLQSNEFEVQLEVAGACFKGKDGTLYFGGPHGFNVIDPQIIKFNPIAPVVAITQFKLFDKIVPGKNELSELTLDYTENFFSFEFAALNYSNTLKNKYAYRLVGIDKDWVYSGSRRTAAYTNIGPGVYTFMVRASNNDGVWNEKGISMKVTILPPWWRSWWFYLCCGLAVIGLIYYTLRLYTYRKLEKQRVVLEKKQAIELERMRISSDLHDDVGGELSAIRLLSEMNVANTSPEQQLSKISLSSGELVKKLNEIVWALNTNNDNLQSLVSYIRQYAVRYLDDVGVDCHFHCPEEIAIDIIEGNIRRNIFLLVKEALNNIVKHASASEVNINIAIHNDLRISIHDNGKGLPHDATTNNNGNGLRIMQQRVNDMNGAFEIKHQQGTTVIFRLPVFDSSTKV